MEERLGILYYVGEFPKISQSFIINEISELSRRGHNVAVFALSESKEAITHKEYKDINIPIYYANASYTDLPKLFSEDILNLYPFNDMEVSITEFKPKELGHNLLLAKKCSEFIDSLNFNVDIIHSHFAKANRFGAVFAANHRGIACTVTAHAVEIFKSPNVRKVRNICGEMDHVIIPSEYNKQYLSTEIGVNTEMTVVPATTSVEKFKPSDEYNPGNLLTVARLVEKKGHEYAINAVSQLVDQGYDVEYCIVGTGEREEFLRQRVRECGIEDYVEFLGHVSDERLETELHKAELFVLPCVIASNGDRDVAPVALKEAMAAQTACVSTSVSAIPELITDGHDGILVEPNNPEVLADAISALLDDTSRRKQIAANGRETVERKFDISQTVNELVGVFQSCIPSQGRSEMRAVDSD